MVTTTTAETHYDVVVVGGGPGGYATALYASAAGLSVALVERDKVGGTCLHRGCIPAKEFLETASVFRSVSRARDYGVNSSVQEVDFSVSQARKNTVVEQLFKGLSGLLVGRKVTVIGGIATLYPGKLVKVTRGADAGVEIVGRNIVLAPGSIPRTLPGLDVDGRIVLTSDEFLDMNSVPESAAVVGGGAIGCEFASLLCDLGTNVTILEALPALLSGCDRDVTAVVTRSFKKRGMEIATSVEVRGHQPIEGGRGTVVHFGDGESREVDKIVVSVGRRPRTEGLLASDTGVTVDERGFVITDAYQQTHAEGVWAVGDVVAGTPQLAHVGFAEAIVAVKGILGEPVLPVDYEKIPWAIYCHPEVAFAGLTEDAATERGYDIVTMKDPFGGNSRARIIGETEGMVKVVAERAPDGSTGRILGVHMVGPWVTEQLGAGYLALNWEATPADVAQFIQPHPTLSETFGETMLALTGRGLHIG
ncbi:MAG: dihydrolipoyl dehydrogenase [Actinobacteria bacterium]|nr:dihydrolipoyl dehydrogenase [Actinomycetota bacterium]MCL5444802.1 dihydrolipoyl dehydrogenase [Actinomycetota bacterium]